VRGLFVTGTDTGVGKTVLSAALLAAIAAEGGSVSAHKPAVTGLDEPGEGGTNGVWPPDHELLAAAAGMDAERVAPFRYGPAVSPQLAAELTGERIDRDRLLAAGAAAIGNGNGGAPQRTLIVEGVGGLFSPLAEDFTVCDLAAAMRLPLLIAARPGLGTINHTLLTLQVARAAGLKVVAVVLTPWPEEPSILERSNRETIARMGEVKVEVLPAVSGPDRAELARAGASLPWRDWFADETRARN